MRSRVSSFAWKGRTLPAGLRSVAARALPDQHQPGRLSGFGGELQPPSCDKREWLFRLGNHQSDRGCTQRFFDRPKQIGFSAGSDHM